MRDGDRIACRFRPGERSTVLRVRRYPDRQQQGVRALPLVALGSIFLPVRFFRAFGRVAIDTSGAELSGPPRLHTGSLLQR